MKKILALAILIAGVSFSAQAQSDFSSFIRTKDSLMHIAFYDKDLKGYRKHMNELLAVYNKQDAKNKEEARPYLEDEYYFLARLYAATGDNANALRYLELSKTSDYNGLRTEADFNKLRKDPGFAKVLATAKKRSSKYGQILRDEAKYNTAEHRDFPAFTYQPASDAHLIELRKKYNLDSVAGDGNDVSKIINLMKWVHYLVPHDGAKGNPKTKNALSFIRKCKAEDKTLNCRGLAIVLNEVYLAQGFNSRFITCMPKDTADNDCHVINMVWSTSLKKWLWMDPTFMAYVMNEQGELLSIEEVRDRIIHEKPLILNPDANRNHATSQTKDDYLGYYMSKNLYKLECPLSSEYNYETPEKNKERKYIQLLPGTKTPETKIAKNEHGIDVYTLYYTNNPATFWAPPTGATAASEVKAARYTQADYEKLMAQFVTGYNTKNAEKLGKLFPGDFGKHFTKERIEEMINDYGEIKSVTYMGLEEDNAYEEVALFKMNCTKSVHCMAISISDNNKFGTFRFKTYSNYIDWRLAKEIEKERAAK